VRTGRCSRDRPISWFSDVDVRPFVEGEAGLRQLQQARASNEPRLERGALPRRAAQRSPLAATARHPRAIQVPLRHDRIETPMDPTAIPALTPFLAGGPLCAQYGGDRRSRLPLVLRLTPSFNRSRSGCRDPTRTASHPLSQPLGGDAPASVRAALTRAHSRKRRRSVFARRVCARDGAVVCWGVAAAPRAVPVDATAVESDRTQAWTITRA
jgi:hypothetical protein